MKILMLVGHDANTILRESVDSSANIEQVRAPQREIEYKGGSFLRIVTIRDERDLFRLAGLRFDLIIEHPSFRDLHLLREIRMMVLRPR